MTGQALYLSCCALRSWIIVVRPFTVTKYFHRFPEFFLRVAVTICCFIFLHHAARTNHFLENYYSVPSKGRGWGNQQTKIGPKTTAVGTLFAKGHQWQARNRWRFSHRNQLCDVYWRTENFFYFLGALDIRLMTTVVDLLGRFVVVGHRRHDD